MRITFLSPPDALTGGLRIVAGYAQRLAERGHQVTVVQPLHPQKTLREKLRHLRHEGRWPDDPNNTPSHFDRIQVSPGKGSFRRIKLDHAGAIREQDVPDADILVATWWETAEWAAGFPPSKGTPAYFIQHYEIHMWGQPRDRVDATWRLPMKKIVIAPWLEELARNEFGDSHAALVPNAADRDLFYAEPRGKQPVPTFGFLYAVAPFKGADVALKALRIAREQLPDMKILAFGSDEVSTSLPLPDGATFDHRPPQARIRELYSSCDAWLFTSRVEGFGLPVLEAMACRTPVIGTPAGAAPALLATGGGLLVPYDDPQAVANAMLDIARMPGPDWRAMSDRAYANTAGYSWEDATDRFEHALEDALHNPAPGLGRDLQSVGGR